MILGGTIMKKIMSFVVCCAMVMSLVSCGLEVKTSPAKEFIGDFALDLKETSVEMQSVYNSYGGFRGEGMALYTVELDDNAKDELKQWTSLPLSSEAGDFLESLSTYITIPEITEGTWKFVNNSGEGSDKITNAELCIYDTEQDITYWIKMDS